MEIPKAKFLIYALTFVGYIWSGYGSGVLDNLKDAVVAAEGFFGDFLTKFSDVVKKLNSFEEALDSTIEEKCVWTCPNGVRPKKNKYYTPVPNGCGPLGLEVDAQYLPSVEMTLCCNEHDVCYGTCSKQKYNCDVEFKRCLYKLCDSPKMDTELIKKNCKLAAKILYTGTIALGCKFYRDSQKEACFCQPVKSKRYPGDEF